MERTLRFKKEVWDKVPAVVHVNHTGRLQSLKRELNEPYYLLIQAFYALTGVPLILNTSFNVMGKPIIHTVEDAISVFLTSGLDALVLEDYLIEKPDLVDDEDLAQADVAATAGVRKTQIRAGTSSSSSPPFTLRLDDWPLDPNYW